MISPNTIQQIQSRIDIIDVIGNFVKLKKRGANYLGLCPFHNEKTPSFTVSQTKEIYKCFGCGKSGNTIGFLMEHEKYSYVEALRWLAGRYNIEIEETEVSPEVRAQQHIAESLFIVNEFARDYFNNQLFNTEEGKDIALSYLKERGFREDIIKKFQLGYNPQAKDSFTKEALGKQYSEEVLLKAGLIANRDNGPADNYRGRIIFPIHNQSGKVLGFGARIIKSNDKAPKYINTPENEIYLKSRILYGSYFARHAIDKENECLLVEGYTDVVSLHQAGIENVVASGGTSLTPDQLRLIKKYTFNLTILYDGDSAGIKAALRGLDLAIDEGLHVKLVLIPDGDDPDSYVYKTGAQGFRDFIRDNKKDFVLFQLELAQKDVGNDAAKITQLVNKVAETISRLNRAEDFIRRQDYVKQVSQILKIDEQGLTDLVNQHLRERINKKFNDDKRASQQPSTLEIPVTNTESDQDLPALLQKDEIQERGLVRVLIDFGLKPWKNENEKVADYLLREFDTNNLENTFNNPLLVKIIMLYKQWYFDGLQPTDKSFLYHNDPEISSLTIKLMEVNTEISPNWDRHYEEKLPTREDLYLQEVTSTLTYFKLKKLRKLIIENEAEFAKATNPEEIMICLQIQKELKDMERAISESIGTVIYK